MKEINTDHQYEYDSNTGLVKDCFGEYMNGIDDHIAEMNMLMGEIKRLKEMVFDIECRYDDAKEELNYFKRKNSPWLDKDCRNIFGQQC
jgi:archaellum component FlaC